MMIREVLNRMVSSHAAASYAKLKTVYQKYATEQFRRLALQTAPTGCPSRPCLEFLTRSQIMEGIWLSLI
jgi:hypothetical protein